MIRIPIDKRGSALVGLAFLLVMPAGAHVGDRVYPIAYLTDEMLAEIELDDGSVEEWYRLIGEPVMTLLDFKDRGGSSPDPSDFDFRIWLAWHDDPARIYVALGATDDGYIHQSDFRRCWGGPRRRKPGHQRDRALCYPVRSVREDE